MGKHASPRELYEALPKCVPLEKADFIQHVKGGTYKFDTVLMESVPKLEWSQLYNIKPPEAQDPAAAGGAGTPRYRPPPPRSAAASTTIHDYEIVHV